MISVESHVAARGVDWRPPSQTSDASSRILPNELTKGTLVLQSTAGLLTGHKIEKRRSYKHWHWHIVSSAFRSQ